MKLAIVGSRDYPYPNRVINYLFLLPTDTVIVSGGARGPDSIAEQHAKAHGWPPPIIFPVDKKGLPPYPEGRAEFARRAKARNLLIVDAADEVVAFWDGKSRGTKHTIDYTRKLGKPLTVIGVD